MDGRRKQIKKYAFSNENAIVWTGPEVPDPVVKDVIGKANFTVRNKSENIGVGWVGGPIFGIFSITTVHMKARVETPNFKDTGKCISLIS